MLLIDSVNVSVVFKLVIVLVLLAIEISVTPNAKNKQIIALGISQITRDIDPDLVEGTSLTVLIIIIKTPEYAIKP